ncbi:MarR family winged helix-turn-helix transcriptional regulator [Sellimonas intestinalis]|uniref:MarR family winged helix-turn-helix transcriptional regulator n=1 Tax=Sellimonas intestinalis TaxID=1653434 RepID=UPI0015EC6233|nr:MarR family transcriptional regulator [Sellimonas intestinalis]MBA2212611.1 MarR family transcriptional regulator [Sellimonas intestinalis]
MHDSGFLIKLVDEAIERQVNNALRQRNLTLVQVWVLRSLNRKEDKTCSFKELEKILNVAQSTCAGIINRLAEKKFVECFTNPHDKRVKLARLTSTGENYVQDVEQEIIDFNDRLYAGISDEELKIFFSVLKKMYENME